MFRALAQRINDFVVCHRQFSFLAPLQLAFYRQFYGRPVETRKHTLPNELIVSLTSFPPRFPTLRYTLQSLLDQSIKPDRLILWLAEADIAQLPSSIGEMPIQIEAVADVRSYKKLAFAIERYPHAFIATADDDIFYPPRWLEQLVEEYDPESRTIVCHRVHRIPTSNDAEVVAKSYRDWDWEVQDVNSRRPSADLLPTTGAGALYFPGSLHADATDAGAFVSLCPTADDLWFACQARRAGTLFRKIGPRFAHLYWAGSQHQSLFTENINENDTQFKRLVAAYGWPIAH